MKFDLPQHLLDPLEFRVLAQSGTHHFLVGFHNRYVELEPSWVYLSTPNEVLPFPLYRVTEMFEEYPQACWGPVCSPTLGTIVLKRFEHWVRDNLLSDDSLKGMQDALEFFGDDMCLYRTDL